ncbi:ABC-type transport auxiliary lipoprotein family protein [Methylophaga sp. OBS4]|uniref:ABC-type transport auxiliary lipoprotein family protein n=1 Tax=Methylophaga sp. OBS4 TaxID=2991935 RepID=UPI002256F1A9|nr:ABC-type transport auxiliary lipoprotein family protein [Methylophaga sp. OBS4]MCX4188069.1 PqiC family protein [Methylophaga sp. OBS4]
MNTIATFIKSSFIVMCCLALTACFSWGGGEDDTPHYYVIDVDRGNVANEFARDRVLLLKPVRVVPHFENKTIVFRVGESEYQSQPPHELFSEPEDMFTAQLRRWLQKTGLFSQVVIDESIKADYVLESAVTALYGEKRQAYSPQAVVEMQFFMSSAADDKNMLFQTGLRVDVDIEKTTPGTVVTGWKQGLEELLATLEQDLSGYFAKLDAR